MNSPASVGVAALIFGLNAKLPPKRHPEQTSACGRFPGVRKALSFVPAWHDCIEAPFVLNGRTGGEGFKTLAGAGAHACAFRNQDPRAGDP